MDKQENVTMLVEEYKDIFTNCNRDDLESLERYLEQHCDWTLSASEHLIALAKNYGSFMLRNALAVSLALEIEDGEFDF